MKTMPQITNCLVALALAAACLSPARAQTAASPSDRPAAEAEVDLARLMPPDALAYVEIVRPGEQIHRIVKMLGLVREPDRTTLKSGGIALDEGFFFPDDFTISPALVAELKKIHGVAAAITSFTKHEEPQGVLAVHPGTSDLLRGLLETFVQFLEPAEPIEGFKTYRGPEQKAWITVTSQLILIAPSREQLTAAVARLRDPKADSLASKSDFQSWAKERQNALVFVHVSGPQIMKQLGPALKGKEAMIARGVLDVDHLDSLVATLGTSDDKVQLQVRLNLMTGQRNLVYSLVRTAPLSRRSLEGVPQGVLGMAMIGLNPPGDALAGQRTAAEGGVSAMDLGREFFANIEELSVFALPPSGSDPKGKPVPEIGVVLAVKDPAKSEALWNQLLALPAMFGAPGVQPAGEIQIEGQTGKRYQFGKGPSLVVVPAGRSLVVGTEAAVTASLKAIATKSPISADAEFAPLLDRLTANSSKAILVDVGRFVQVIASTKRKGDDAIVAAMLLKNLKVSAVTDEAPTQLSVTVQATGLPNVPALIKMAGSELAPKGGDKDK